MAELATPTPAQHAAITAAGSVAVTAGAGCGKTTVLAERFVHLLRPGPAGRAPVDEVAQILAITFTEKAAGEMKRRIRALVGRAVAEAPEAERGHWERVRRELLGAQISTIHALCARVLRDNPLEAGIDPHAVVLDEYESRDHLERLVETELLRRLRAGDTTVRELVARTRGLRGAHGRGAVRTVTRLLEALGRLGRDGAWLVEATVRATDEAVLARAVDGAANAVIREIEAWLTSARPGAAATALAAEWPDWCARLRGLARDRDPAAILALAPLAAAVARAKRPALRGLLRRDADRLDGDLAGAHGALAAAAADRRLAALVAELERVVAERKRAEAVLTFDDLVRGAAAVLAAHPSVARRYAGRFRAVLVDEFQDTDAVQAEIVRRLADAPGTTLFVVGDEKQSIYRFRGAEIAVFKAMRDGLGASLSLGRNFRSQPGVLAFVNALAGAMFQTPDGALEPEQWTRFDAGAALEPDRAQTSLGPSVRLVSLVGAFAGREVGAREAREIEARVLAEVVHDLATRRVDPVAHGDVAVLLRTLNQVKAYEYALARRGIPYYVVKGRGFFQAQEVRDLVNLLGVVARPDDGVALAAVLRSPLFGVDDDTLWRLAWPDDAPHPDLVRRFHAGGLDGARGPMARVLARARDLLGELGRRRSRSGVADLLLRALAVTDLEAVHLTQPQGRQRVANVRKVIELARDFDRRGRGGLAGFVTRLRTLDADDPREAEAILAGEHDRVVRLMTIHQAKGLEFPVVVLADLGRALEGDNETVVLDRDGGLIAAPVVGAGAHALRHAGLEGYRARERERSAAEYARLLYVACTRAADELILIEGRGKPKHLETGDGDATIWCHRVWDVVGREAVAAVARHGEAAIATPAPGVAVSIEPASAYLARSAQGVTGAAEPVEAEAPAEALAAVERALAAPVARPAVVATTPTALATFQRCARQYWYAHVLRMDAGGGRGRRARLAGMLAHGVLETMDLGRAPAPGELARVAEARPETLQLRRREVRAIVGDLERALGFVRTEVQRGLGIVAREVPVALALPALAPVVVLQGRIDVLARRGGRPVVQDYKYADASAGRAREYGDQLAAYRLAVARTEGGEVDGELVFLRGRPTVVPLGPLDPGATEAAIVAAGEALAAVAGARHVEAFPRGPAEPEVCVVLECPWLRRCWGAGAVSDTAPGARPRTGAA